MSDLFFYGKLKGKRDFVSSSSLPSDEKNFWANWFDGCVVSKSLPNFLKQKATSNIWLFVCKTQALCRIGFIAMSQDYSGRLYPFVVYQITEMQDLFENHGGEALPKTIKLNKSFLMLKQSIERGEIVVNCQEKNEQVLESNLISQRLQNCFDVFCDVSAESQSYSCWVKLSDDAIIKIATPPTRSLYTKLFG